MRDNLLFFGPAEPVDDSRENCISLTDQICSDKLGIDSPSVGQSIDRAHRIGRRNRGGKYRPIVVKFNDYKVREKVRSQSYRLRNTRYSIQEQYPKPISDRRKELQPIMHEARRRGDHVTLVKDKLYINE
ncbi:hypothetical protein FSP39_006730 [Pinctada imbricata]|uniref:Uncharacterized protein n=1 Tax=Pinctada imbricata TaxID=66713 RepID=A0AA88Y2G0_PINIB|nr:hypothetical protein FSP39_006730 [Pinctada imbricata]